MYYVGIDLGGTSIVAGLVDENNKLIDKATTPTLKERPEDEIIADVANLTKNLLEKNNLTIKDIESLGIGSPGSCNDDEGIVIFAGNLGFKDTKIREKLQKHLDIDVRLANDADSAALGEFYAQGNDNIKSFIAITLGTGVGGGIVLDGKLLTGKHYAAAEIGHIGLVAGGEQCTCGRKGCFEAYCSATAIIREINRSTVEKEDTLLKELVGGNLKHTNAKMVFDAMEQGDVVATRIVNNYYDMLAEGIGSIINIFDPEIIAIGGGVSAQGDKMVKELEGRLAKYAFGGVLKTKIKIATLGNDAGVIGAALIGKKKWFYYSENILVDY